MSASLQPDATGPARIWALTALGAAIAAQLIWFVLVIRRDEATAAYLARPAIFTVVMGLLFLTRGRAPFLVFVARVVIGGAFLNALWHRFDNFSRFIAYTGQVNSFLPTEVIPFLAVLATLLECLLCAAMLLGIATRWAALGSAGLLFLFATAMAISGVDQFEWAVYVLSAGSWVVAESRARFLSADSWMSSWRAARLARG